MLKDKNYLFVDGRYTLQANNQSGKNFKIVTIPNKKPEDILKGKRYQLVLIQIYLQKNLYFFWKKQIKLKPIFKNLIDKIWKRKIIKNKSKFYSLPNKAVNEKYQFKD